MGGYERLARSFLKSHIDDYDSGDTRDNRKAHLLSSVIGVSSRRRLAIGSIRKDVELHNPRVRLFLLKLGHRRLLPLRSAAHPRQEFAFPRREHLGALAADAKSHREAEQHAGNHLEKPESPSAPQGSDWPITTLLVSTGCWNMGFV